MAVQAPMPERQRADCRQAERGRLPEDAQRVVQISEQFFYRLAAADVPAIFPHAFHSAELDARAPARFRLRHARSNQIPRTARDVEFELGGKLPVDGLPWK
ncbi:MAG TPA: hypothetical protein VN924_32500 [Bryobacteraceae bacterium]|nr:hypothetical protein [Bryobacteraceae bacterium]